MKNQPFSSEYSSKKNYGFRDEHTAQNEKGNALLIIFVLIALFAALSYVFSDGTRSGVNQISKEKAQLAAAEVLDYGAKVKRAVQQLQINGCSDTEINFNNSVVTTGYTNPNAPTDNSCDVFHPNGGGLSFKKNLPEDQYIGFTGNVRVYHIGNDTEAELLFRWSKLQRETCVEINKLLNFSDTVTTPAASDGQTCPESITTCRFQGVYNQTHDIDNVPNEFHGINSACYDMDNDQTNYIYYTVLIPR